ncbi:hypothetical protein JVT61DRAFT_8385 [Boletus reticuloceps]|uniref:DEAD/DEAH box helicase domain-containing protein n=1 Tax=Boletus reticuloceps TaxID=495285 RepID=A0A8I2YY77_9AGAM|nr:hypothetical protein JVT61DRAFT_8385 [Boletus reticuloceps]
MIQWMLMSRCCSSSAQDSHSHARLYGPTKGNCGPREHGIQSRHLMSNKKHKLPNRSFKRSRRGFEEIHIPALKKHARSEDELIPVTKLPGWTQAAFTVPRLDQVQSKLISVAFGTDEPILLCATTGAGKVSRIIIA